MLIDDSRDVTRYYQLSDRTLLISIQEEGHSSVLFCPLQDRFFGKMMDGWSYVFSGEDSSGGA
jgi:hypothetical protein